MNRLLQEELTCAVEHVELWKNISNSRNQ